MLDCWYFGQSLGNAWSLEEQIKQTINLPRLVSVALLEATKVLTVDPNVDFVGGLAVTVAGSCCLP